MPDDIFFLRAVACSIYLGNGQLIGSRKESICGPSTDVLIQTISQTLQPDFYCSVQDLIDSLIHCIGFSFLSVLNIGEKTEHIKANMKWVETSEYLHSMGMLKDMNGEIQVHMKRQIEAPTFRGNYGLVHIG